MPRSTLGRRAGRSAAAGIALLALLIVAHDTDLLTWIGRRTPGGLVVWILTAAAGLGSLVGGLVAWGSHPGGRHRHGAIPEN